MKLVGIRNEEKKKRPVSCLAADLNSTFVYQSGANVQATWRKYGWVPPTEYRDDYLFAKNRESA
jgi:hypothetical protein